MVTLHAPVKQPKRGCCCFSNPPLALVNEIQSQTGRACFLFLHLALFLLLQHTRLSFFFLSATPLSPLVHRQLNPCIHAVGSNKRPVRRLRMQISARSRSFGKDCFHVVSGKKETTRCSFCVSLKCESKSTTLEIVVTSSW